MVGKFSQVRGQEIPQPKWGIFSHDFRGTPTFPATHLPHTPDSRGQVWVLDKDFPSGLLVKTLCFQFRGPWFNPWSGN